MGTKGEIAQTFAELINTVWTGEETVINLKSFKVIQGFLSLDPSDPFAIHSLKSDFLFDFLLFFSIRNL